MSRSAHVLCWGSAHWHSASQCAGPGGPARRCGLQGLPPWLHACRWRTWQCFVDPQRSWAPFCDVICIWSIRIVEYESLWDNLGMSDIIASINYPTRHWWLLYPLGLSFPPNIFSGAPALKKLAQRGGRGGGGGSCIKFLYDHRGGY